MHCILHPIPCRLRVCGPPPGRPQLALRGLALTALRSVFLAGLIACVPVLADSAAAPVPSVSPVDVLGRYFRAMELQQTRLQGAKMEVDIDRSEERRVGKEC